MQEIINTALMYIGSFYSINTVMFRRPCPEFLLPNKFANDEDHTAVLLFLKEAPDKSVCYLKDHLFLEYCFAILGDNVVLVGPYRTRNLHRYDLDKDSFRSEEEMDRFLRFFHSTPVILKGPLRTSIELLFHSVYGISSQIQEIREADLTGKIDYKKELLAETEPQHNPDVFYDYIAQISRGNYPGAIRAYKQAMNSRGRVFNLMKTIEGVSTIRAQTRIALHQAGIPEEAINGLLNKFKIQCRMLTSIPEARNLCEQLIYDSCKLVNQNITKEYSASIADAISYIHHNIERPLSVSEIAEHVGITPNSLSAKFHSEVGVTPMAYMNKLRMEQAAKLLRDTKLSIPSICYRIGIEDSNYFTRCFKKEYGMPPSEYRKNGIGTK